MRMPERRDRQFAAKANCFNAGYARLRGLPYDIVGNLDALPEQNGIAGNHEH